MIRKKVKKSACVRRKKGKKEKGKGERERVRERERPATDRRLKGRVTLGFHKQFPQERPQRETHQNNSTKTKLDDASI